MEASVLGTYLVKALKAAANSDHPWHKVGAVILNKRGRIISFGWNASSKTHPVQKKWARMAGESRECLHAEIHALVGCRGVPHSIYVARVTAAGNVRLAKPCKICVLAIADAKISKVFYTTNAYCD